MATKRARPTRERAGDCVAEASPGPAVDPQELLALKIQVSNLLTTRQRLLDENRYEEYAASYSPSFVNPRDGSPDGYHKHRSVLVSTMRVLALMGGNRTGKTKDGAFWITAHLTGRYPVWWTGKKYARPVRAWAAGVSISETATTIQADLLGEDPNQVGNGMIPRHLIMGTRKHPQVAGAFVAVYVRHITGGTSTLIFKAMEQGRENFQSKEIDVIWLDEEPKRSNQSYEIFSECRTRLMTSGGQVLVTYTPLKGQNELYRYLDSHENHDHVHLVHVTWDDAPHLTPEVIREMEKAMLPHELEARKFGRAMIREGLVFPFAESQFTCDPFPVPDWWPHVGGLDVAGFGGSTAAVMLAMDPKTEVWYTIKEYCKENLLREDHANTIRGWGEGIFLATDPSANRTEADGSKTMKVYRTLGLNVGNADNEVYEALNVMAEALLTGKLKVFKPLRGLLEEIRFYQFEKGLVKKTKDHRVDSWRYAFSKRDKALPLLHARRNFLFRTGRMSYASTEHEPVSAAGY